MLSCDSKRLRPIRPKDDVGLERSWKKIVTYTWVLTVPEERRALLLRSFVWESGREFFARPWETALYGSVVELRYEINEERTYIFGSLAWEVDLERSLV